MSGKRSDPEVPLYGKKVIGVRYGTLDLHGRPRSPAWVDLSETATAGATSIKVKGPVSWFVGDEFVIASTSYNINEAE